MPKFALTSVGLYVRDRKKAADWYIEKLGARLVHHDAEHWTTVRVGRGPEIHLCEKGEGPLTEDDVGNSGILFVVEGDLKAAHREMAARGVRFSQAPQKLPWGWSAHFLDLDGNEFTLVPKGAT